MLLLTPYVKKHTRGQFGAVLLLYQKPLAAARAQIHTCGRNPLNGPDGKYHIVLLRGGFCAATNLGYAPAGKASCKLAAPNAGRL